MKLDYGTMVSFRALWPSLLKPADPATRKRSKRTFSFYGKVKAIANFRRFALFKQHMDNDLFVRLLPEKQANRRNLEAVLYCGLCVCICVCACVRVCVCVCACVCCMCVERRRVGCVLEKCWYCFLYHCIVDCTSKLFNLWNALFCFGTYVCYIFSL